ncbi:hypothetical protein HPB52_018300 [Rhipicephalus sanguineus]|uniref:Major facilitator superfamily (MFS) profile domain-containing protein n=1 Tax=Rhipicephalus sanguineus TaxID=34632 RepID=A0A9D4PNR8_RHISA|nr:hypothetical protein HPB52_018300 [Rhipicephalus sanguineus]
MPKIPKPRRRKRERKMTGFQTPPSSMPGETASAQEFPDIRSTSLTKRKESRQPKTEVPLLTEATVSPLSLPSTFLQETAGVAASPPAVPLPVLSFSSASTNADGRSPLPPPSMVSSSGPGLSPMVLASRAEPPASQPGACAVPNSTTAPLHLPTQVPSPPEVQTAKQRDADRPLLLGASYGVAARRHTSLRELAALRSMRLRSLSGEWVNRGQMLLTPLLSRLRSSSSGGSPQWPQQSAQMQQTANVQVAAESGASDERARLAEQPQRHRSKLRWYDERHDHHDSAPCVGQNIPSSSRTSGSLAADPVQSSRHSPALKATGCSQCEESSQLVGKHGAFQTTVFYFVLLVAFVLPFQTLPLRIVNHDVDYWCARPSHLRNISTEMWKEVMIPRSEDDRYSRCRMNAEWNTTAIATVPCQKWEYAQSTYGISIVQDFNLVCERAWYLPLSCSAFAVGAIFTLIVSGQVADRLGRKVVIQFFTVVLQAAGVVIVFSTVMNNFIAMRLLQGAAASTLFNTSFVLLVEVLSPEHRTLYSIAAMMGKVFGAFIASVMMWAKFSWYTLQVTSMLPCFLMLNIFTVILESPRWLLARGNVEDAEAVILQAATLNGQSLFEVRQQWARTRRDFEPGRLDAAAQDAHCEAQRARCCRHNSVILYYLWTVTTVASEAASLKIHYLDWYPAALLALSSLLAFPTECVAIVSAARLGRRASQCWALGLAALACFVAATLGDDSVVPSAALLLVASVSVDASQTVGTLYTAEMYPTVVRCTGLALCKSFSAVASVATPLAAYLGLLPVSSVPLGVMSIMCVTAAYLAMCLPDTIECTALPDQFAEAPLDMSPP